MIIGILTDVINTFKSIINEDCAYFWRAFIFIILFIHIALAYGLVPGVSGFAFKNDIQNLKTELDTFLIKDLEEKLFNMQERLCDLRAEKENDSTNHINYHDRELRYKERIRGLLNTYRKKTSTSYILDQCAQL